ncbi:MAG: phage portal protein [Pirellulales bacterium]
MLVDTLLDLWDRRATGENPSTPLDQIDDDDSSTSWAGVSVSRETALTLSAMWRGVNVISRDVAKLPLHLYRRAAGDGRERATAHPSYRLVRRQPNTDTTPFIFWQQIVADVLLQGNGYAAIYRRGDGMPREIVRMLPDRTWPVRADSRLTYTTTVGGELRVLDPANVLHVKGLGYDGLGGYSVLAKSRESLGWSLGMRKYSAKFFKNGARSAGVLMTPGTMTETAAKSLQDSFNKAQAGLDNAHKTILLEEGAKYVANTISQDEAQFLESMQFSLVDVANWLHLAPHKVGHPGRTSYASLEQENQSHLDEAIDPWLVNIEQECGAKLLSAAEIEADTHYFEFTREALIRVDFRTKQEGISRQIQDGRLSPNEARALDNLPPREGGDRYWMPANMRFADEPIAPPPPPPDPNSPDPEPDPVDDDPNADEAARAQRIAAANRLVLTDACRRGLTWLGNKARNAAGKPQRFLAWLNGLEAECRTSLTITLAPAVAASVAPIGPAADPAARTRELVDAILAATRDELLNVSGMGKADELQGLVDTWAASREAVGPEMFAARLDAA